MSAPCCCKTHETTKPGYSDEYNDPNHPANLICQLCRLFYDNGWVTGTGGGISIRDVEGPDPNIVYIAPSGVQKERIKPYEMFVVKLSDQTLIKSPNDCPPELTNMYKYKLSACTPLFISCYTMRDAGACIHTHSQNAVMMTLLLEGKREFRISHIEQIKALPKLERNKLGFVHKVGSMQYFDTLVIPIIENTSHEEDLTESLQEAIKAYPSATAVLVRRHGIYVWGETVWKAKVYNEAIDYLLELGLKINAAGMSLVSSL